MATREEARQKREEKLDELHEKLTGAVERLVTGEDWADALRFAARFRSRSFNNVLLNRPGFRSVLQARMEPMNQKYSPEMRERALRMLDEAKPEHPNLMSAVRHVAGLLGMSPETLRVWHRRREIDAGQRPGVPTDVAE